MITKLTIAAAFGAALCGSAFAQQADYSADDVVKFFVDSQLGATRGLCVGTEQDCKPEEPKGFDMMINFDLDSAVLTDQARANLEVFARAMRDERLKEASFVVEGHTDASGSDQYNDGLSERRAASVTAFLQQQGVDPAAIRSMGMGERQPRVDDPLDPVNRRVEMRLEIR